jgi:hypothetical protein
MESTGTDNLRTLFVNYVTDRLSAPEREEMEDRLLADQEFSDSMAICEQELIDAYATRSLTTGDAENLRPWIEGSETRLQRVALARTLLQKRRHVWRLPAKTVLLALAACLLLTIGLIIRWSPWIQKPGQRPVSEAQAPSSATSPAETKPARAPVQKTDIILLVAERIRGQQGQIPTFIIHPGNPIKLEILLATDAAAGYGLKIVRSGTRATPVYAQPYLEPHSIDGQEYLSTMLTGESLSPGTYDAILTRGGKSLVSRFVIKRQPIQ